MSLQMQPLARLLPKLILMGSLCSAGADAQTRYDLHGELFASDRIHARQALEKQFGDAASSSYRMVADGCIVPSCTDVQTRTAVYVRDMTPLGALKREHEVYCSAPAGAASAWTCGQPATHYILPTAQGTVRARIAHEVSDEDVLRFAAYLRSACNTLGTTGAMSVRSIPGKPSSAGIWVWVGMKTFSLEPAPTDAQCAFLLRSTGFIVI